MLIDYKNGCRSGVETHDSGMPFTSETRCIARRRRKTDQKPSVVLVSMSCSLSVVCANPKTVHRLRPIGGPWRSRYSSAARSVYSSVISVRGRCHNPLTIRRRACRGAVGPERTADIPVRRKIRYRQSFPSVGSIRAHERLPARHIG